MPNRDSRIICITGAGAGIGQALAIGFVARGDRVIAIGRSPQGLADTVARASGPGIIESHLVDVTNSPAVEELFQGIVHRYGGFDLLINGAAVYPHQELGKTSPEDWAMGVSINLSGVAYVCRAALLAAPPGRRSMIFNVGSFAHRAPDAGSVLYCTTKAAVSAFSKALAAELDAKGSSIIVNEWVPGIYKTRMSGYTGDDPGLAIERLLAAWDLARVGPGGRIFEGGSEVLPPRSLRSRLKRILTGGRN